jgi:hypothetical protein
MKLAEFKVARKGGIVRRRQKEAQPEAQEEK